MSAKEDEVERTFQAAREQPHVALTPLGPDFNGGRLSMGPKWANVVSFSSDAAIPLAAAVVPRIADGAQALFGRITRQSVAVMEEGLVLYGSDDLRQFVRLPSAVDVAKAYFASRGFSSDISSAGRIAMSIVGAMNGLFWSSRIAYRKLIEKLNLMSHGGIDAGASNASQARKPAARARSETYAGLLGVLKSLHHNIADRAERHLRGLIESGVFRIGLELQCTECTQTTWFPLDAIRNRVRCERCSAEFAFPIAKPPRTEAWTYRTQGAFSVENFAHGSYSVVLALRLLHSIFHDRDWTWVPSMVLRAQSGSEFEVDFAVWRREFMRPEVSLLLGEAKTFGEFGDKDFRNARALARAFPGAYWVFVTLKESLTNQERRRLRALARDGRRPLAGGAWRNPVVVITGREIFSDSGPPYCWRESDGEFRRAAEICKPYSDLRSLAAATQLAYLGLEPDTSV